MVVGFSAQLHFEQWRTTVAPSGGAGSVFGHAVGQCLIRDDVVHTFFAGVTEPEFVITQDESAGVHFSIEVNTAHRVGQFAMGLHCAVFESIGGEDIHAQGLDCVHFGPDPAIDKDAGFLGDKRTELPQFGIIEATLRDVYSDVHFMLCLCPATDIPDFGVFAQAVLGGDDERARAE